MAYIQQANIQRTNLAGFITQDTSPEIQLEHSKPPISFPSPPPRKYYILQRTPRRSTSKIEPSSRKRESTSQQITAQISSGLSQNQQEKSI
ncbi:hypothetical protein BP00DRAFT_7670 [Aspergillus indologenus CBS 114.80]|uniref:Uncharacterized protein n=1 Tax=Aspergillus indologenus CBS 114.80 TaxID=1450541 RepID=A0A2V5IRV7_9EURO|nr:hypothetical protein BP00DRAFT_7670 [Aspergillus indologenus CBS 114.80]